MRVFACMAAALAALLSAGPAQADETTLCTEITALPFTITSQGIYCLKQNLNVNLASGNAITINAGNVTIDFNGWRVNNQAALASTEARGVFAQDRKNITVKNGFIRGFSYGVYLNESTSDASGSHLVEDMKVADSGRYGIYVQGDTSIVRNNRVLDTGGGSASSAFGILLSKADDSVVSGNIVAGVYETFTNSGIYSSLSNRVLVTGNGVSNVNGGSVSDRAIALSSVNRAIVDGNRLVNNPGAGTFGIEDDSSSSANINCLDNVIGGFGATPLAGCDVSEDNRQLFN